MNTEIVRVLEEAFPEPWPVEARIGQLMELMAAMNSGASNEAVARFVDAVDETLAAMAEGRVEGLTDEQRQYIKNAFVDYEIQRAKEGRPPQAELPSFIVLDDLTSANSGRRRFAKDFKDRE